MAGMLAGFMVDLVMQSKPVTFFVYIAAEGRATQGCDPSAAARLRQGKGLAPSGPLFSIVNQWPVLLSVQDFASHSNPFEPVTVLLEKSILWAIATGQSDLSQG